MDLIEIKLKKLSTKVPPPRNFVHKNAQRSGSGPHTPKGFQRHQKHKSKEHDE